MKTVVLDTNVLLDIFVFNDFRAIPLKEALINQQIDALACPKTLEEFADVISRPIFSLERDDQQILIEQWTSLARVVSDAELKSAPWQCHDPDDQVFLDLAYSYTPSVLISKDNAILILENRAQKDGVMISADYRAAV